MWFIVFDLLRGVMKNLPSQTLGARGSPLSILSRTLLNIVSGERNFTLWNISTEKSLLERFVFFVCSPFGGRCVLLPQRKVSLLSATLRHVPHASARACSGAPYWLHLHFSPATFVSLRLCDSFTDPCPEQKPFKYPENIYDLRCLFFSFLFQV